MTIFSRRLVEMGMDDHLISIINTVECGEPYLMRKLADFEPRVSEFSARCYSH